MTRQKYDYLFDEPPLPEHVLYPKYVNAGRSYISRSGQPPCHPMTLLNTTEDLRWLQATHLPNLPAAAKSVILCGNEDSPEWFCVFLTTSDPAIGDYYYQYSPAYQMVNIHKFIKRYIAAAIWSSTDDEGEPLDKKYSTDDLADETVRGMEGDCHNFVRDYGHLINAADMSSEEAGHDFWLTRCRHGTGYFDRGLGELGELLTGYAHSYGEVNLYVGDDGKIYS